MFCTECGNKLEQEAKFCSSCGSMVKGEEKQESQQLQLSQESSTIATYENQKEIKKRNVSMSKSKWAIIAISLVIILLIGFMAKDYVIYAISPELYIKNAFGNTIHSVTKDYYKMQSLILGNNSSDLSYSTSANVSIKDASHTDLWENANLYILKGLGIDFKTIFDNKNKEYYFAGKYQISGNDVASLNLKLDDNELLLNVPELFDEAISVPSKSFGSEWNRSIFGRESYYSLDDDLDISLSNLLKMQNPAETDTQTKSRYIDSFKTMLANGRYEKNGSTTLMIGGAMKKCNRTTILLREDNVKQGLMDFLNALKSDDMIKTWSNSFNQGYSYYDFEEAIDEAKYELKENFKADKVSIDLFTNNGKVVKAELIIIPDSDYEEDKLEANIELLGEKILIDNFKLEIAVADEKIMFESEGNHIGKNNMFIDNSKFTVKTYYGEEVIFNSSTKIDFNKDRNNFDLDIKLSADGESIRFNTIGDFKLSNKSISFISDEIQFTYKDYYDDVLKINLIANIIKENSVKDKPDFDKYSKLNVFKMDEYEMYNFISSIEERAFWLGQKIEEYYNY